MKRKILALLLCISMVGITAGCETTDEITLIEREDQTNIGFSWWGTDPRHDYTMEGIKVFEEQNPGIRVHMEYSEWTGYDKKNAVSMVSNTESDVCQINFGWVKKYSKDGTGYYDLEKIKSLDLSTYSPEMLDFGRSNGVLNALPIALNTKIFEYNQDIYQSYGLELPTTWDDFYQAAAAMNGDGIYPLDLDVTAAFMTSVGYVEQSTGKEFLNGEDQLQFTAEEIKQMISFYLDLVDKKVVMYVGDRADTDFEEGINACTVQWITNAEKYQSSLKDQKGHTAVIGTLPILPGAANTGWYTKPASMYVISKNTQNPEEAGVLLDFLVNSEDMAALQGMEKGVPVSTKAKAALEANGMLEGIQNDALTIMEQVNTKIMSPKFETTELQTAFKNAIDSILFNDGDLDTEAETAYLAMQDALK